MERSLEYPVDYWKESLNENYPLNFKEAMNLVGELELPSLMKLANHLRSKQVGDTVSYAVSYNINYSNYCTASCPICAFYVPMAMKGKTDRGYELSIEQVKAELSKAKENEATEVHIVGGFNASLKFSG